MDNVDDQITVATITVMAALGYADWRAAEDEWRVDHPRLESYFSRWMMRDSFAHTMPKF